MIKGWYWKLGTRWDCILPALILLASSLLRNKTNLIRIIYYNRVLLNSRGRWRIHTVIEKSKARRAPVLWSGLVSRVGASQRDNLTAPFPLGQNCPRKITILCLKITMLYLNITMLYLKITILYLSCDLPYSQGLSVQFQPSSVVPGRKEERPWKRGHVPLSSTPHWLWNCKAFISVTVIGSIQNRSVRPSSDAELFTSRT